MLLPTIDGVRRALAEIQPYQNKTPLLRSILLSDAFGADVWLKNETVTEIGCFKLRGALAEVLRLARESNPIGVVTSSSGNHGQGVAYAGRAVGLPVTVFLPLGANPIKRRTIELLGAEIREVEADSYGTKLVAQQFAAETGRYFVDDGSSIALSEGAGTVGLEIAEQLGDIDAVFIPVGDAALINGSASALKALRSEVAIIGVQALGAPAYALSHERRTIVDHAVDTVADGLATRIPAQSALDGMLAFIDRFVLVGEDELLSAMHTLAIAGHILSEPAGAATLAAAWRDRENWSNKRIVLVVTGANVESGILRRALDSEPLWKLPS